MLALISTVGADDANSYATVAEADAYHERHLYATAWNGVSVTRKTQALVMATALIDEHFEFDGVKATSTQALRWPRFGMEDADGYSLGSDSVPQIVKDATAEYARHLIVSDLTAESGTTAGGAIDKIKVGPIEIGYTEGVTVSSAVVPASVRAKLRPYGIYRAGVTSVPLYRV